MAYFNQLRFFKRLAAAGLGATLMTASLAVVSAGAQASDYYAGGDGYEYALVTGVTPIYNDIQVVEPRTRCWEQPVTYQQPSPAGAIIGGLIGAAVGRNLAKDGHRHRRHHWRRHHQHGSKAAGTVAGAAVGAVIGGAVSRSSAPVQHTTQQRCEVVEEVSTRREVIGYDVRYRYNGQEFLTRTDRHPGDRIRVRVDVTPVW